MTQAGYYQPRQTSPTAMILVVLLHGAAIAALVATRMDFEVKPVPPPIKTFDVRIKPDPELIPPDPIENPQPHVIDRVVRIIPTPPPPGPPDFTVDRGAGSETTGRTVIEEAQPQPPPPLPPEPVRRAAQIDPRVDLKPPYPASEQRLGNDGTVTVRVLIGPDGRVKAAEKLRATSDAFFQATLRHALRNWRFKPATIDGRPVESSKVMTLHFRIEDAA